MRAAVAALLLVSCTGGGASTLDASAPPVDAAAADAAPADAGCEPGTCHHDCFGGTSCWQGVAFVNVFTPIDCCEVPGADLHDVCAGDTYACAGGACRSPRA